MGLFLIPKTVETLLSFWTEESTELRAFPAVNEPKGVSVLPHNIAPSLRVVAARLLTLRVRELDTRSPLILLLGLNTIQETSARS